MTHEIHLVARAGAAVDQDRVIAALMRSGHWHPLPAADGLKYFNPDTGVEAWLEPMQSDGLPDGYRSLGLGLVLNYLRPTWFAMETLSSLADAASAGDLLLLDPQVDGALPTIGGTDALISSWERGNRAAVAVARSAGADVPWIDPDRSLAFWRHQHALARLKLGFASRHYVPALRLVRRSGDDRVERAMSWPDFVPTILPECDLMILLRSDASSDFVITGVADARLIRERLADATDRVVVDLPDVREITLLTPERAAGASHLLGAVHVEAFEGFTSVPPDGVVDVAPE